MLIGLNLDVNLYFTTRSLSFFFLYFFSGAPANTVGWRDPGFTHTSFLKNLWPNSEYVSQRDLLGKKKKNHKNMKYVTVCNIYIAMVDFSGTLTNWGIVCSMVLMSGAKRHFPSNPRLIRDRTLYNALSYLVTWER